MPLLLFVLYLARLTVRTFGIRRNEKIACHVTIRGPRAYDIVRKALEVKEFELIDRNFSSGGTYHLIYIFFKRVVSSSNQ